MLREVLYYAALRQLGWDMVALVGALLLGGGEQFRGFVGIETLCRCR
jgi:hypothetical protein